MASVTTVLTVSLTPMLVGIARSTDAGPIEADQLTMREAGGEDLGSLQLASAGTLEHPRGRLDLFRPVASSILGW